MSALPAYKDTLGKRPSQDAAVPGDRRSVAKTAASLVEATRVWISSLYLSIGSQSGEKYKHLASRFMARGFRGVAVGTAKGFRFRWFVLTESEEAVASGLEFGKAFHKLIRWLRYYCPDFQYIIVEHKKPRRHWHLVTYGSDKLPCQAIREYWLSHYQSTITGMAEIRSIEKAMYYVAGYLKKGGKLARSWSSAGWVFRGWIGFTAEYKHAFGHFPSTELLVRLAKLDKSKRQSWIDSSVVIWKGKPRVAKNPQMSRARPEAGGRQASLDILP